QLLEVGVVHHLVELAGQLLVDGADPVLDVGLDVLGDDLAGLDHAFEELLEVGFGAVGLLVVLRLGRLDHLVEQAGGGDRLGGRVGGRLGLFRTHQLPPSGFCASMPISLARAIAFSVLPSTSASNASSLSLPSILESSCVSRCRMSSSSLSGPICSATRAGSK